MVTDLDLDLSADFIRKISFFVFMSTMQHKIVGKLCGVILELSCTVV